jgi:hypothetical protein
MVLVCACPSCVYVKTVHVVDCYRHSKLWAGGGLSFFLWYCFANLPVANYGIGDRSGRILYNLTLN